MSKSHTAETFSRFVVAMVIVVAMIGAVAWAFSTFDSLGCAVGVPCHKGDQPTQVSY
jgi:hypothetical protein